MASADALAKKFMRVLSLALEDDEAAARVSTYFSNRGATYSGRRFEEIGGRGDAAGACDRLTPADLIALATLSVPVNGAAAVDLLEGRAGDEVAALLAQVPTHLRIGDPSEQVSAIFDQQAPRLYAQLTSVKGIGWVSACKLMARKRPFLFPVYDEVVRSALDDPPEFRRPLRQCFLQHGLGTSIERLRSRAVVPDEVSDLRVLDVAVWMKHRT